MPTTTPPQAGPTIEVPIGEAPILDGTLSVEEWAGAHRIALNDGREILLLHDGTYLYLGIRAQVTSVSSPCIQRNGEILILHASAALGTAVYRPTDEGWQRFQAFGTWYCRAIGNRPEAQAERNAHLEQFGWLANNVYMGTSNEMEYQITLSEEPLQLAVVFLEDHGDANPIHRWPAGVEDNCSSPELVTARAGMNAEFVLETWATINLQSRD